MPISASTKNACIARNTTPKTSSANTKSKPISTKFVVDVTRRECLKKEEVIRRRLDGRPFQLDPETPECELEKCAICYENIRDQEIVSELFCSHIYHPDCIKLWLANNDTCPVCVAKFG